MALLQVLSTRGFGIQAELTCVADIPIFTTRVLVLELLLPEEGAYPAP